MQPAHVAAAAADPTHRSEFEQLYTRSHRRAYNLAFRMLGNPGEAEDVTQDAFVRAWRSFHQYDRGRPFEGWLFRIVANLAIDRQRRQRRVPTYSLDAPVTTDGAADGAPLGHEFADPAADPAAALLEGVMEEPIQRALAHLPADYRAAVLLADVEERSYLEISEIMQCAVGTVRSRIHRGRNMLRRTLEQEPQYRRLAGAAVQEAMQPA